MAERFESLTAVAAPYEPINVDTDQILPGRFLKMPRTEGSGYGQFLFHDLRQRPDGTEDPSFVLNQPAYRAARIFVANANFACGSSREGAAYAFSDYGIRSVIAPSFSDIFFNNCLRNGIVPVRLPDPECARLRALLRERPGAPLTVDLRQLHVQDPDGRRHPFEIDDFFRQMMIDGIDEIELTRRMMDDIVAFEQAYHQRWPWAAPAGPSGARPSPVIGPSGDTAR